jgi:hypothetical protein
MVRIHGFFQLAESAALCLVFLVGAPVAAHAWGNQGHRIINRLAASSLPADVPSFLRSEAALSEIEYLDPEPDRWRSPAEPELNAAQAPEHFIDQTPSVLFRTAVSILKPGSLPLDSVPKSVQLALARQDVKERESRDDIRSRSDDSYSPRRHWCSI